jgi:hypothetical protein
MTNTVELNQTEARILRILMAKAKPKGGKNDKPVVFSIEGRKSLVVLPVRAYQKLLGKLDAAETRAAIYEGLEDLKAGRCRPAREVMEELCKEFGLATPRVNLR